MKIMKTTTLFLTLLLAMNISLLSANTATGDPLKTIYTKPGTTSHLTNLAPSCPKEADFSDDISTLNDIEAMLPSLTPSTPEEAAFEDPDARMLIDMKSLTPDIPAEADFNDQ